MMFYVIYSLSQNSGLRESSSTAPIVLSLGTWVIMIFSIIFIFYLNSFLMKRRKKEIGLYNILGMEKKHVMIMLFYETLCILLISLLSGIVLGGLFSQLMCLILVNLCHLNTLISFEMPIQAILLTIIVYGCIYLVTYLFNIVQVKMNNPIELLKGEQFGEREPQSKWLLAIIGIMTLGAGYALAQLIEDPLDALAWFFVAVILVIIGTYCLFTAGSIVLLKSLKKNKHYYYHTKHFISVSQMVYRMKQNAVGLASICILCTCILVMLSSTVTLYFGIDNTVSATMDSDYLMTLYSHEDEQIPSKEDMSQFVQQMKAELQKEGVETSQFVYKTVYENVVQLNNDEIINEHGDVGLTIMLLDDYNQAYQQNIRLKDNEILAGCRNYEISKALTVNDKNYTVRSHVDHPLLFDGGFSEKKLFIVVKDETCLKDFYPEGQLIIPTERISISFASDEKKANQVINHFLEQTWSSDSTNQLKEFGYQHTSRYEERNGLLDVYGSLFFLGIYLGVQFLMAAILIMYYKQLSEGYEDQKRFEILQNVGMSKKEVKQVIHSQVMIFFFLPLMTAVIHMIFASKMIIKMFGYIIIGDAHLFLLCTLISIVVLALLYTVTYVLTARVYYKIVKN